MYTLLTASDDFKISNEELSKVDTSMLIRCQLNRYNFWKMLLNQWNLLKILHFTDDLLKTAFPTNFLSDICMTSEYFERKTTILTILTPARSCPNSATCKATTSTTNLQGTCSSTLTSSCARWTGWQVLQIHVQRSVRDFTVRNPGRKRAWSGFWPMRFTEWKSGCWVCQENDVNILCGIFCY